MASCNIVNKFKPHDAEDVRGQLTFEAGPPRPEIKKPGAKLSEEISQEFPDIISKVSRNIKSVMLAKIQML